MLPEIGALRPWADPSVVALKRLPMHTSSASASASLDGQWVFRLFSSPDAVPTDAVLGSTPVVGAGWTALLVPGTWSMQGVGDGPHYTNVRMPFAGPPPRLPEHNPTGVYRREFSLDQHVEGRTGPLVLTVGGADAVHVVYVNGTLVGYGTDARLPSEYDISPAVRPGRNDLAIVVVRYAAHSYLEDQDAWWLAGLHRGVRLERRPPIRVADVRVTADFDPATRLGSIALAVQVDPGQAPSAGLRVRWWVETPSGARLVPVVEGPVPHEHARAYEFTGFVVDAALDGLRVEPWSAERPALYTCRVELVDALGEVVDSTSRRLGFRRVRVEGNRLLVNGERVWIFGVNRHDHHPDRASAVTVEDLRSDLVTMRRHNVNAIRTSHYPNDDAFYDLCDELGFYVVDEANLEAHAYNRSLADDPRYRAAWLDRGARMVERDRNHPCVILWSLGNESGYGVNHDALAAWIRSTDPSRPVHYEDAIRIEGWQEGGRQVTDLVCPMYPSIDEIREYGESTTGPGGGRPLIMCEYSHAMGNSNGSLGDYWDVITTTPGLQGGFLWEWKDQALRQTLPDGRVRLAYGGQFGDRPHDGNFVADGLVAADGTPHPAMAEVAWVHRPVTVHLDDGALVVTSRRFFASLDDLDCTWELVVDGEVTRSGSWDLPLEAGERRVVPVPVPVPDRGDTRLTVRWTTRSDAWFAPAGYALAWDQVVLRAERIAPVPTGRPVDDLWPDAHTEPRPAVWRAATDNDGVKAAVDGAADLGLGGSTLARWRALGLDRLPAESVVRHEVTTERTEHGVRARHGFEVPADLDDLPRVGVVLEVDPRFTSLRWWGRGPHENYPDRARSAVLGTWTAAVEPCPYLVPQEFGLRTDTSWLELEDPHTGDRIRISTLGEPFAWSATRFGAHDLFEASNDSDLVPGPRLVVHLDAAHRGIGTGACGPDVLPQYRVRPGRYELAYAVSGTAGLGGVHQAPLEQEHRPLVRPD
ncbi:glycoside hydrolase family 2 TIM barrel-domain containing protein [Actinotalea sp.]|uniref:glycoside hydrolase family 2 TIM barrel-domain containing protein n=1 Tax=Actinotalea sp. TaxID=1872145 RepID=UPI003567EC3B